MKKDNLKYSAYISILKEELVPAMGCTEPIALAYAGAKGRQLLGKLPEKVTAFVSGSIIKNVKSVIVPNTGGLHGIKNALVIGRDHHNIGTARLRFFANVQDHRFSRKYGKGFSGETAARITGRNLTLSP